jgi:hypothetical protein
MLSSSKTVHVRIAQSTMVLIMSPNQGHVFKSLVTFILAWLSASRTESVLLAQTTNILTSTSKNALMTDHATKRASCRLMELAKNAHLERGLTKLD